MKMKRILSLTLCLCMTLSLVLSNGAVAYAVDETSAAPESTVEDLEIEELDGSEVSADLIGNVENVTDAIEPLEGEGEQQVKVLIVMSGDAVVQSDSSAELNDATAQQMETLEAQQAEVISDIEATALDGDSLDVNYQYTWLTNAVAATVPSSAISAIEAVDGVEKVLRQRVYSVCETESTSAAQPKTISDGVMIGREDTWANGYTGKGVKIAVIDTGLDMDHQNFAALSEDKLTADSATKDFVGDKLASLNAASRYAGLSADDVYYNTKVAFGFNYCDDNLDVTHDNDTQGDHGTHVAGIAAANKVDGSDVVGVAPDAQLYIMKVFGSNGGAYDEDILAALEDALMLGADVVNMSLGSTAGFTTDGEEIDAIYDSVANTGTILSIAAGNEYTSGYNNTYGLDASLTENMDNATVGSPGTYANVVTVASVENLSIYGYYFTLGDEKIGYSEADGGKNEPMLTLADGTGYGVVAVPGVGDVSDYEGLDVTGKIALVQRGTISFGDKCDNAQAAGAVACLIYNNTTGAINMSTEGSEATIPCASITLGEGERIKAALEADPATTLAFSKDEAAVPNPSASQMSDFSSWGVAPDLSLEPDIAAPGGNIYSTRDNGTYGLMSGTSMATPNVAGISALVVQYAKELGYSGAELHDFVYSLLVSTSEPLPYDDEILYSPRSQGSGLANAYNAVTTQAYLTVDGSDVPKAELGDDVDKTGSYGFSFDVNNIGDKDQYYTLDTTLQTEGVNTDYQGEGYLFMSSTPEALTGTTSESSVGMVKVNDVDNNGDTSSHDAYLIYQAVMGNAADADWTDVSFRYDVDNSEAVNTDDVQVYLDALVGKDSAADLDATVLRVPAGETTAVNVSVKLSDGSYFDTYYPNGGYVEGFNLLTAKNSNGVDLSLPYLGFYGDWSKAPIFDTGWYWEGDDADYSQYAHVLFTNYTLYGANYDVNLGMNPYVEEDIDTAHISLSPDDNGYGDYISDMYIALLRNAGKLNVKYTNTETGELYYEADIDHVSKSVYNGNYGQIIPAVYSWYDDGYDLIDPNTGAYLENNTKLTLSISASIDYPNAPVETMEVPITIDTEAPTLLSARLLKSADGLEKILRLSFKDNLSVSAITLVDTLGTKVLGQYATPDEDAVSADGYMTYDMDIDVSKITGKVMLILGDYAFNESYYGLNMGGKGNPYGDFVAFQNDTYGSYTWTSFDADVDQDEIVMFQSAEEFVSAEYVNGYIFAETKAGKLYALKYTDMLADSGELTGIFLANLDNVYQDMAYDYKTGTLYALNTTDDEGSVIYKINLKGSYYDSDEWVNYEPFQEDWVGSRGDIYGLGLACDDEGNLWLMGTLEEDGNATLIKGEFSTQYGYTDLTFKAVDGSRNYEVGDTGVKMDYLQSMTWNHNDETLYWAQFYPTSANHDSTFYSVDTATAKVTALGELSGETFSLTAPLKSTAAATHTNVPAFDGSEVGKPVLNKSSLTLTAGGVEALNCTFDPWYTQKTDVTWTSDDESIAVVNENGVVTGVSAGSCTVTVTSVKDPSLSAECAVTVSSVNLNLSGVISHTDGGIGVSGASSLYDLNVVGGKPTLKIGSAISGSEDVNFGTKLSATTMGRGSMWACEWGNTGMIYQIDAATGTIKDVFQPIDGDVLYGMTYSSATDKFAAIANYDLYVDLPMSHDSEEEMLNSFDESTHEFTWHRLRLVDYLEASDEHFSTGENGSGSIVDVVLCGITSIPVSDEVVEAYQDYLGNWSMGGTVMYLPNASFAMLDNVGRIWYMDEITGMTVNEYGDFTRDDGSTISQNFNGVMSLDNGDGTYNVFFLREIEQTPLYDMYKDGTMPRYSYTFSDMTYAGKDENGGNMFALSLYDYWNNSDHNEFYLYLSGTFDWDEYETVGRALYDLGSAGHGNVIATINSVTVTDLGNKSDDNGDAETHHVVNGLYADVYQG